jgi:hypothetical protein
MPGRSGQVIRSRIVLDVAASEQHHACQFYFDGLAQNGLIEPWSVSWQVHGPDDTATTVEATGAIWCNPPYAKIAPWVKKASEYTGPCVVAVLVPAAVGSNWWADFVDKKAQVLFLGTRLTFKGHNQPYPKDCALLIYGAGKPGYRCVKAMPGWLQSDKGAPDA